MKWQNVSGRLETKVLTARFASRGAIDDANVEMTGVNILVMTHNNIYNFSYTANGNIHLGDWTSAENAKISGDRPKDKYDDGSAAPFLEYLPKPSGLAWTCLLYTSDAADE